MSNLHLDILPLAQREIWPLLRCVPNNFVLYGGTAIALYLGHRLSEDFDFFTGESFNPDELRARLVMFPDAEIKQHMENTLTLSVPVRDDVVKLSFFGGLPLNRTHDPIQAGNGIYVASLTDLLGTKCKVVIDRAAGKDYLDVAAILKMTDLTLAHGIATAVAIYGESFLPLTSLKALSYTSDLSATLPGEDLTLIQEAVAGVALDNLPRVSPTGIIGERAVAGNVPDAAEHRPQ